MKFHRVTISMVVPVGDDIGSYGKTPEDAGKTAVEQIREVLGVHSTAGIITGERLESWKAEPEPED